MGSEQPTNADLKHAFDTHAFEDAHFQEKTKRSLELVHKKMRDMPTKDETAQIVEDVFKRLLLQNGKAIYTVTVGASVLVGALLVLFGGFKTILALVGFTMSK